MLNTRLKLFSFLFLLILITIGISMIVKENTTGNSFPLVLVCALLLFSITCIALKTFKLGKSINFTQPVNSSKREITKTFIIYCVVMGIGQIYALIKTWITLGSIPIIFLVLNFAMVIMLGLPLKNGRVRMPTPPYMIVEKDDSPIEFKIMYFLTVLIFVPIPLVYLLKYTFKAF